MLKVYKDNLFKFLVFKLIGTVSAFGAPISLFEDL